MWQMMLALPAIALCAAAAGCAGRGGTPPGPGWDLSGVIAAVEPGTQSTRVTIELSSGTGAEPQRAVLHVAPETEIVAERPDGTTRRGSVADLAPGARIQARHTGVAMRSMPPQYNATAIRVSAGS